jgi:adenine-specific DNA-methyltransferase
MPRFPMTQYHGSKRRLVDWILAHTPECTSVLDAFSGSGVVAYAYKQKGKRVIANDLLTSSYYFVKATVENSHTKLSDGEIERLFTPNAHRQPYVEAYYAGVLYPADECRFLDNLYANIAELEDPFKRSIALAAAVRTCVYKMPGGKFRPNLLPYRSPDHRYYKPKFQQPIEDVYRSFLLAYNAAVFDNGRANLALNADILDMVSAIEVDVAYFDPPYGGSNYDYLRDYFFVELYTRHYGQIHEFSGEVKRHRDSRLSKFRLIDGCFSSLRTLFERAAHIPCWVVSYNNRSHPPKEELVELVRRFKPKTTIVEKGYTYKSGDNNKLRECLFVCRS